MATMNADYWLTAADGVTVYDLGHDMYPGMPIWTSHIPYHLSLRRRHGDTVRPDGVSAASDVIIMSGHTGTHIDALCHISRHGRMHGGADVAASQGADGFSELGVETIEPIVGRGVLLDVARYRGVETLGPGYEITADDLAGAAAAAGIKVRPRDCVTIRTGWDTHFSDAEAYVSAGVGAPGPGEQAAQWLAEQRVRVCGSDSICFECMTAAQSVLPVHAALLVDAGIPIIEGLSLGELAADGRREFLLIVAPLRLRGATGSPVRPLAIVAR
jgi:kynurenine formamidase